ncbi:cytochrome c1 [Muricoccus aerilatus]|uniref:cytochrome c1 n=1 Tax=Muricoccus aerilatus TaxID=452982 RepID=UPI0006944EF3|nr:cytochrome c1 [Roseomonas aerilata]
MRPLLTTVKAAAVAAAVLLVPVIASVDARAQEHEVIHLPDTKFTFEGPFGTFDRASAQRGFQVYKEVCSACHSMRQLSYRNLSGIGLNATQIAALASQFQVQDGPNDNGEMFERPARASDRFRRPFQNDAAARAANNGALPPDLSVMIKAREGGADYVHALLVGYEDPPPGVTIAEGMHYNKYFPGHQIAMAAPLNTEGQVEFADGTKATIDQMATDVVTFLSWAAEPELEQRRAMGVRMVIFLTILGGLVYAVKRKVWANLHQDTQ